MECSLGALGQNLYKNLKIKLDNTIKISLETSIYIIVTNKKIKRNEIKI